MTAPHPAIAIIRAGSTPQAIEYLERLADPRLAPAIAMLEAGYVDFATYLLQDLPAAVVAQAPDPEATA